MNGIHEIRTSTYTPYTKNSAAAKPFPPSDLVHANTTEALQTQQQGNESVLTTKEQNFFEQLYPDSTQELRSYQTYRRDGERMMVSMGSLIDRKG